MSEIPHKDNLSLTFKNLVMSLTLVAGGIKNFLLFISIVLLFFGFVIYIFRFNLAIAVGLIIFICIFICFFTIKIFELAKSPNTQKLFFPANSIIQAYKLDRMYGDDKMTPIELNPHEKLVQPISTVKYMKLPSEKYK